MGGKELKAMSVDSGKRGLLWGDAGLSHRLMFWRVVLKRGGTIAHTLPGSLGTN